MTYLLANKAAQVWNPKTLVSFDADTRQADGFSVSITFVARAKNKFVEINRSASDIPNF